MDELRINKEDRDKIYKMIGILYSEEMDRERLYEIIKLNYSLMN